jgi:2,3-bisphosphoglycerate-independent phosphoglycerate mutase
MAVIKVPGATGYIDTNYEGKARAAIEALKTYDFVYLHLEAIDEVSHEQNLELKIKAIEDFDSRIITPVLQAMGPDVNCAVLPDHPVPIKLGRHTRTPVPVSARVAGLEPDGVTVFNEIDCLRGSLGAMKTDGLMRVLLV